MDNRIMKYFIIVLALFIIVPLYVLRNSENSSKNSKVNLEIDYSKSKVKSKVIKHEEKKEKTLEEPKMMIDKVEHISVNPEPLPESVQPVKELVFCKSRLESCNHCQDPYDSNNKMRCEQYLQEFEQKNVAERLRANSNFREYLSVYHPDVPIEMFHINDLKSLVRNYAALIGVSEDDAFIQLNIEKDNILYCYTYQENCL